LVRPILSFQPATFLLTYSAIPNGMDALCLASAGEERPLSSTARNESISLVIQASNFFEINMVRKIFIVPSFSSDNQPQGAGSQVIGISGLVINTEI
jgi:hypothetical protein